MGCWSLCTLSFSTLVECVSDIDGTHMNTLQDGWTALMVASQKGQVAGVTMLLDRGAEINMQKKVTGVIIHCVDAMQHVQESTVVDDDVCTGSLFRAFLSCYFFSATSNKHFWENALKLYNRCTK